MGGLLQVLKMAFVLEESSACNGQKIQAHAAKVIYFSCCALYPYFKCVQRSLYFKTTHGTQKMWSYIAGGLKIKVI